jgi:hypothetical protein
MYTKEKNSCCFLFSFLLCRLYKKHLHTFLILQTYPTGEPILSLVNMLNNFRIKFPMQKSVQQRRMFKSISGWQQSGLTQKAWCEKNNIAYATFHYWYKRYRSQKSVTGKNASKSFVQLMVDSSLTAGWCELALPDGKKLVFQQAVSVEFLRTLIS